MVVQPTPKITPMHHITPAQAWHQLQSDANAVLIDVRMEIESLYVGRPPGAVNVPWYEYPDFASDAVAFARQVEGEVGDKARPVLLLCRSGSRTLDAARALEAAGFTYVANVLHGFEGDLDEAHHRSTVSGWRFDGLPWEQM